MNLSEAKLIWLIFLTILTLANGIYLALKIIAGRNGKKEETFSHGNNPHPCQAHGERLRGVEVDLARLREDNKDEHQQLRSNIARIFNMLNGTK